MVGGVEIVIVRVSESILVDTVVVTFGKSLI